jgi:hypothetical protein
MGLRAGLQNLTVELTVVEVDHHSLTHFHSFGSPQDLPTGVPTEGIAAFQHSPRRQALQQLGVLLQLATSML